MAAAVPAKPPPMMMTSEYIAPPLWEVGSMVRSRVYAVNIEGARAQNG
jgi:hypothetical protein